MFVGFVFQEDELFETEHRLRHLPFFEEIASREESHPEWRSATAGLVVLRLVDAWLEDGPSIASDDCWSIKSVCNLVEEVDPGTPIRTILSRVINALQEQRPDIHVVVTPLMAYGQALEYDAKWTMAADVYQSVLAHLHPVEDSDASVGAHLRLGSCYRSLHRIEEAAEAYSSAFRVASAVNDMVGILRARLGEGVIAVLRGNLPRAAEIFDDTVAQATGDALRDVRSRALHERSNVAHFSKQYELAIQIAYEALGQSQSPTERDRILSDIAGAFLELGVFSAARDAYMVLSATAQEQYMRWLASMNLLEISAQTGAETLFELYRRQFVGQQLPPYLATALQVTMGKGYQRFGDLAKARGHLERAVALAEQHSLNQYLFEAEEALLQLETLTPPRRVSTEVSVDVKEVASAIRELRESVGAS